jgi:hypothetical protein
MLSEDSSLLTARNNLAMTLVALGQSDQALEQIDIALTLAEGSPLLEELLDTRKLILSTPRGAPNQHRTAPRDSAEKLKTRATRTSVTTPRL